MHAVEVGTWNRDSLVQTGTLESLRGLNHRFLDLMVPEAGAWSAAHSLSLPQALSTRERPLTSLEKQAIAACPYALFNLRFDDHEHWQARVTSAQQWTVADEQFVDAQTLDFVKAALFFAWHVAATAMPAARFLLGMSDMSVIAFRGVTIDRIPALAATDWTHLAARWRESSVYWDALTRAACRRNTSVLRRVQLSGLQMAAAAELH